MGGWLFEAFRNRAEDIQMTICSGFKHFRFEPNFCKVYLGKYLYNRILATAIYLAIASKIEPRQGLGR